MCVSYLATLGLNLGDVAIFVAFLSLRFTITYIIFLAIPLRLPPSPPPPASLFNQERLGQPE